MSDDEKLPVIMVDGVPLRWSSRKLLKEIYDSDAISNQGTACEEFGMEESLVSAIYYHAKKRLGHKRAKEIGDQEDNFDIHKQKPSENTKNLDEPFIS